MSQGHQSASGGLCVLLETGEDGDNDNHVQLWTKALPVDYGSEPLYACACVRLL